MNRVSYAELPYYLRLIFVDWFNLGVYGAQSLPGLRIFSALRVYSISVGAKFDNESEEKRLHLSVCSNLITLTAKIENVNEAG